MRHGSCSFCYGCHHCSSLISWGLTLSSALGGYMQLNSCINLGGFILQWTTPPLSPPLCFSPWRFLHPLWLGLGAESAQKCFQWHSASSYWIWAWTHTDQGSFKWFHPYARSGKKCFPIAQYKEIINSLQVGRSIPMSHSQSRKPLHSMGYDLPQVTQRARDRAGNRRSFLVSSWCGLASRLQHETLWFLKD